jgi:uncharacterized protein YdhG (YjbR/CyaY superfamily)
MPAVQSDPRVDAYIAKAPANARAKLEAVRRTIRQALPGVDETFSYGMPGFSYPGFPNKGVVAWFSLQRTHIGLYLRDPTIRDHRALLKGYATTKFVVRLPIDRPTPTRLIQTLVRASNKIMRK